MRPDDCDYYGAFGYRTTEFPVMILDDHADAAAVTERTAWARQTHSTAECTSLRLCVFSHMAASRYRWRIARTYY
jgi:hypothetical protein